MKKIWLITFNLLTLFAWSGFIIHLLMNELAFTTQSLFLLNVAQGLAIFEILNAVLGLAGANWFLTSIQVGSRLLILGLLNWIPAETLVELNEYSGFAVVAVAWSVTEIVRALYYVSDLLNKTFGLVIWMRYTFFIVLYPLGVTGEFMIMFSFAEWRHFIPDIVHLVLAAVALSYLIFFPKLYLHMFKQRKKKVS